MSAVTEADNYEMDAELLAANNIIDGLSLVISRQRQVMQQALDALLSTNQNNPRTGSAISALRAALAEQPAEQEPDGLHLVLAGAIFDFAGYMTTRSKVIEVGSTANAAPVADLVKEWAKLHGLSLDDAAVLSWQEWLPTAPQPAQVVNLTDEQASVIADKMVQAIEAHYRTRGGAI